MPFSWRPDLPALKNAIRAAIVVTLAFALTDYFFNGSEAPLFACFGSFAMLVLVDFSGPIRQRLIAYWWLYAFGAVMIVLSTLASDHAWISVSLAAVAAFGVIFAGALNGYFGAAQSAAILIVVLPVMIPGTSDVIPDRLVGWTIASAFSMLAVVFIWPTPWTRALHRSAARTCRALASAAVNPADADAMADAEKAVVIYRNTFVGKPNRPTGASGPSAAVAGLVDELGWFLLLLKVPPRVDAGKLMSDRLTAPTLEACARSLEHTASRLEGNRLDLGPSSLADVREKLLDEIRDEISDDDMDVDDVSTDVNKVFWLRRLCTSALAIGQLGITDLEWTEPKGLLRKRVDDTADTPVHVLQAAGGATKVVAEQAAYHSVFFRQSLRGGFGIGLAVFVAQLTDAQNAFWVVLGTLSVLRTTSLGTRASVSSALVGTLAGIAVGGVLIYFAGTGEVVLWILMPFAVFAASYASKAISFAAGQAGFAILVMVLFNLLVPIGWTIGIVRLEDVAMGCLVSLVVGALFWPSGTKKLIRGSLSVTLDAASKLQTKRAHAAADGLPIDGGDEEQKDADATLARLDAAIRQHITETGPAKLNAESLAALAAVCARLRHSAEAAEYMSHSSFYAPTPEARRPAIHQKIDELRGWYSELAGSIASGGPVPEPRADVAAIQKLGDRITSRSGLSEAEIDSVLTSGWLLQHLEYAGFLESWAAPRAEALDPA